MMTCGHLLRRRNRRADKRVRLLARMAAMRAAKARKRSEQPPEHEPRFEKWYPLEIGVRDAATGEEAWEPFRSLRDAMRRLAVVRRHGTTCPLH